MRRPTRTLLPSVLALSGCLLAGCAGLGGSGKEEPTGSPPASLAASATQPGASAPATGTRTPTSADTGTASVDPAAAAAGVDPATKPAITVKALLPTRKDPQATLELGILGLKRKGKLAVLSIAATPRNSLGDGQTMFDVLDRTAWMPTLIDTENLQQYPVVRTATTPVQSEIGSMRTASGQTVYLFAVFPAPPAAVKTINLRFSDAVPLIQDVPVQ